jgi:hypothetical protein
MLVVMDMNMVVLMILMGAVMLVPLLGTAVGGGLA